MWRLICSKNDGYPLFDQHVVSYLELIKQKYTGCNPRGLTLTHDKALANKILTYHRIHVPHFAVFPINRNVTRPKRLKFPLFVKSVSDEGSVGIAQASFVRDDEKLKDRVNFIHRQNETAAIAEEYIEGRELISGYRERQAQLHPWELVIDISVARPTSRQPSEMGVAYRRGRSSDSAAAIATSKKDF